MVRLKMGDQYVIGLSEINVERMRAGQPISFKLADLGLGTGEMLIVWGQTEADIVRSLGGGPEAVDIAERFLEAGDRERN